MNKILIEVPTWLGDSVMTTPAIENIINTFPNVKVTVFGSNVSLSVFENHPSVERIIIDKSRQAKNRYIWLYKMAKNLKFDATFSFRRQFSSKFFAFFINSKYKYHYQRYDKSIKHQAIRYNDFINNSLNINTKPNNLKIIPKPPVPKPCFGEALLHRSKASEALSLGINPGASYGSAKRWYPQEFAKVIYELSSQYDIVIFGGLNEVSIAADIEKILIKKGVKNYQNLAGKTNVLTLIETISKLDLFITGDSGPMHVAASFQVPTIAIFGPTKDDETSQWMNHKSVIVKKNLDCQPCMQRICPLKHHNCMKLITAKEVLKAFKNLV